ncbi:MAG: hypothetical protein AAGC55_21260, partial [Myxococcota bacterium]
ETAGVGRVRLIESEDGDTATTEYWVESDEFEFRGGRREAGRASSTPVLVAIALDERGRAVPLSRAGDRGDDAPTVFSYLPTRERSGLRFLIHAHFDLPVDRERLDLDALWNRWAVARAGQLLARAGRHLSERSEDGSVASWLDIWPLSEDIAHPAYGELIASARAEVAEVALLPAAGGGRLCPRQAAIIGASELAAVLAGIAIDPAGRRALAPLSPRRQQVARALGASDFGPAELVALLAQTLAPDRPDPGGDSWLIRGYRAIIASLARARSAATAGARIDIDTDADGEAAPWLDPLKRIPLVRDRGGGWHRGDQVARSDDDALRAVYGDSRRFIHPELAELAELAPGGDAVRELLAALGVVALGADDLIADLRRPERASLIAGAGPRGDRLLDYLSRLPAALTEGLGQLALFPDIAGELRAVAGPAAGPGRADPRAWLIPDGPLGDMLTTMTGTRPALLDRAIGRRHRALLRRLGGRTLDLRALLDLLSAGALTVSGGDELRALHLSIDAMAGDLTPRLAAALARAPLFPDRTGQLRPLVGEGRARLPAVIGAGQRDWAAAALAPDEPWIDPDIAALDYLDELPAPTVGPAEIAAAVAGTGDGLGLSCASDDAL